MEKKLRHIITDKSSVEAILDFLPYPFILSEARDGTNVNIHINQRFIDEIGYTLEEIPDINSWFNVAYPDPLYRKEIISTWNQLVGNALVKGEHSVMMRVVITTKHNSVQWYEVKSSITGTLQMIAFVNITELIDKERELARLNETHNQMLSILAHDVRGPLTNLRTMSQLMIDGKFKQHEFLERLMTINDKSSQVLHFIDTTLLWTRANFDSIVHRHERTDIRKLLDEILSVYESVYQPKKIDFAIEVSHSLVDIDGEILTVILRNLISNAIKFTREKGSIRISSTIHDKDLTIVIKDDGIGMSAELVNKLGLNDHHSERGTWNEKGSGLGIKLCKQLLVTMKGQIAFKSDIGRGTEVTVVVPTY